MLRILYYHNVVERRNAENYYSTFTPTVDEFREHVRVVGAHFAAPSVDEIIEQFNALVMSPRLFVHVTFDDGFAGNMVASEILSDAGLPWTLFALGGAVLDGVRPWYVELADALAVAHGTRRWGRTSYDLDDVPQTWQLARKIKDVVLRESPHDPTSHLRSVLDAIAVDVPDETLWPFLDVRGLTQIAAAGGEIGSHSWSHPDLTGCDDETLSREVLDSGKQIEAAISRPVRLFSYPDGRYNARVQEMTCSGYSVAMAVENGIPGSRTALDRYAVPAGPNIRRVLEYDYPAEYRRLRRWRIWMRPVRALRNAARHSGWLSR